MKQISLLLLSSLLLSCSAGVKKDFLSGLKVTNSGLAFEQAYMSSDGKSLQTDQLKTGQKVTLQLTGVKGFELIDDMAYPGATIEVIDKTGVKAMELADLFSSYNETGVKPTDAQYLSTALTIGNPLLVGETYTFKSHFWDKNGSGEINGEMEFTVVE
ncbi:hypothetical protein [Jiulongibacter sediminis]|uniref:Lipoprotein n=1 Tax=Jiulongibacter sediminis TaxID=1605367 RepID=A0A0P7BZ21_9BACT|nr:hypothetical protein [Jiulongibacter sediminis]KPM47391.1 hypothetical protein AFM12_14650 [Jiulongibacter sediminis]TBX22971.1 hypothetical protein TK44_14660 [Jiulongibacter sediminis]